MKWKKYTIYTTTEAEDIVSLMLTENGVEGVQIEDNVPLSDADTKGMFIDILPDLPADDGSSRLSFFLRLEDDEHKAEESAAYNTDDASADRSYSINDKIWSEADINKLLENVRSELDKMRSYVDIGEGRIEEGVTEDTDWRDNWKQFFKPALIDKFLIKPSWEEIPDEHKAEIDSGELTLIEIDPGTAFGTGSHETTQLCLAALDSYIKPGDKVLDIGTGSGILGIAALKRGAGKVMATELDEMCESSILDNISLNNIREDSFKLVIGNVIGDEDILSVVRKEAPQGYDVVIANILAPVIVMLAGKGNADALIRKDGIFITSGIIDTRMEEVKAAFLSNPDWKIEEINTRGEWVGIIARRI